MAERWVRIASSFSVLSPLALGSITMMQWGSVVVCRPACSFPFGPLLLVLSNVFAFDFDPFTHTQDIAHLEEREVESCTFSIANWALQ